MKARRFIWVLSAASLGLAACPKRPLSFGPRGEITDPREALAALASRSAKLHRLRSEISVSAHAARGGGSTRGLVAAERPARLHLELDDFFGNPAAVLTTDGVRLGYYEASSHIYAMGPVSPENVAKVIAIEIPAQEAVDVLFGDPQPLGSEVRGFFVDRNRRSYALLFVSGEGASERRQRIDLDTETLVPVGETIEGWEPFDARLSNFEGDSGLRVPRRIELNSPGGSVTLKYRELEVNPAIAEDLFVPRAPPGASQQTLDQ